MSQPNEAGTLLSDIKSKPLQWLWEKYIPRGKLTTLDGDPGLGKSLITLDLAARITTGRPMPDGTPGLQGNVILIAPEDSAADTIKPRIEAAGGDPSRIRLLNLNFAKNATPKTKQTSSSSITSSKHLDNLFISIFRTHPILVIIDPFITVLGSHISAFSDQQIRENLLYVSRVAEHNNCAVLLIRHLNKGNSQSLLYQGSGSIGIIATVRTGYLVTPHPSDEKKRLFVSIKNNLSEKPCNLAYQVIANTDNTPSIQWLGTDHSSVASFLKRSTPLSPERQAILKILQATNHPLGPKELAQQTGQDHTYLRQMLRRMLMAGDIISPSYGRYTTHDHLSPEIASPQNNAATPATPTTSTTPTTLPHH